MLMLSLIALSWRQRLQTVITCCFSNNTVTISWPQFQDFSQALPQSCSNNNFWDDNGNTDYCRVHRKLSQECGVPSDMDKMSGFWQGDRCWPCKNYVASDINFVTSQGLFIPEGWTNVIKSLSETNVSVLTAAVGKLSPGIKLNAENYINNLKTYVFVAGFSPREIIICHCWFNLAAFLLLSVITCAGSCHKSPVLPH